MSVANINAWPLWLGIFHALSLYVVDMMVWSEYRCSYRVVIHIFIVKIGHALYDPVTDILQFVGKIDGRAIDVAVAAPSVFLTTVGSTVV